ncbi:MAG: AsnC family transcriptional regulator [Selenomonadaceae bacterium]|nr:AsnC family transcriptional regulator [Selenomonadaceae bacterium]
MCNSNFSETSLSEIDKKIVQVLQEDFPLSEEPYKILAEKVGIDEDEFIQRVKNFVNENKIRKLGAVLQHRTAGFKSNALCVWNVPPENLSEIAEIMSAHSAVSHCYDRNTAPNWNYNLYTMIHAKSRAECDAIINELSKLTGITDFQALYSKKEWKKTSMKYFADDAK